MWPGFDGVSTAARVNPSLTCSGTWHLCVHMYTPIHRSRTKVVAEAEKVKTVDGGLEACVKLGNGDMRRCLNLLQSTHMGFGIVSAKNVSGSICVVFIFNY